ncbi:MAG: succinate dehydrogenase hydrophobic membrane anchor subunit [Actinomycetota bacterium]
MARATTEPAGGRPPEEPEQRGPSLELWAWLFMRLSGILLVFLAVGHVLIMHVVDAGVERVNFGFVAARWQSPFWRTWDWMLLSLALLHGVVGVRTIILDYVKRPGARLAWSWAFGTVGFVLFVLGTVTVLTFRA